MSKNLSQLQSYVIRKARIDSADTVSINAITEDANDGLDIIARIRVWDELTKLGTLTLSKSDGDISYPLNLDVDVVENVRITLPVTYYRPLELKRRRDILDMLGAKSNNGTGTPSSCYFAEPVISSSNVETKQMSFNIMPDQSYTVSYDYQSTTPELVNPTDYPFFPESFHHILGYYCMMQYAERNPDQSMNPDSWERKWLDGIEDLFNAYPSKLTRQIVIPGPNINYG